MDAIEIIGQIEIGKLSLHAGDILVARYLGRLRADDGARIRAALELRVPEGVKVLVTDAELEFSTLEAGRGFAA